MNERVLPTISRDRCTGCGLCMEYCPTHAVEMVNAHPVIAQPQRCAYCGLCEEMCPAGAISLAYDIVLPPQEPGE